MKHIWAAQKSQMMKEISNFPDSAERVDPAIDLRVPFSRAVE
jgi:hypothetical protein